MSEDPVTNHPAQPVEARLLSRGLVALAWLGVALLAILALRIGLTKAFSVDEFTYAHGSWLLSQGMLPFRDFFETRFPLHYLFLSLPFLVSGDDPAAIGQLRVIMLVFFAILGALVYRLSAARRVTSGVFSLLFLLGNVTLVIYATEIRPDPVGLAFFLASLAILCLPSRFDPKPRAIVSGALLALSCLGTLKAVVYGAVFVPIWLLDVAVNAPRKKPCVLGAPWIFAGVVFGIIAGVLLLLVATGSWDDFYRLAVLRSSEFVGSGTTKRRIADAGRLLSGQAWVLPLIAIGWLDGVQAVLRSKQRTSNPEWLLLLALPSSLLSYLIQSYAYPYSFIPFLTLLSIFGGRGVAAVLDWGSRWSTRTPPAAGEAPTTGAAGRIISSGVSIVVALAMLMNLASTRSDFASILSQTNEGQLASLRKLGELTSPDDPIYDNSGSYVARPHAYSPHHTDSFMRRDMKEQLTREVPVALYENGAVAIMRDQRSTKVSRELRESLRSHFQPYSDHIWLWGQRYDAASGELEAELLASQSGRYFVEPESVLATGSIKLDGRSIREPVFDVEKGRHSIEYRGPAGTFHILWLPRNGERYRPVAESKVIFSDILVAPKRKKPMKGR